MPLLIYLDCFEFFAPNLVIFFDCCNKTLREFWDKVAAYDITAILHRVILYKLLKHFNCLKFYCKFNC